MKHRLAIVMALGLAFGAGAQQYDITFRLTGAKDSVMYIARHHRDQLHILDSARRTGEGTYRFTGRRAWKRNIYALVGQNRTKALSDFCIDGSQKFSITADSVLSAASAKVKGCPTNEGMFKHLAIVSAAYKEQAEIEKRMKDPATKEQAQEEMKALADRMKDYNATALHPKKKSLFMDLINFFEKDNVPDSVENKPLYYRQHYWDNLFTGTAPLPMEELVYTPNLFNHVNYFFFGTLYHADSDTINAEVDRLMERIGDDTLLRRYVMDFITPRYYRSTNMIGWDAVWCHLMERYYLQGSCPWVSEGNMYNMKLNYNRIRKSIIGAHGQELYMLDTTQIDAPEHWKSSHRFPTRYVILWFWDPDCHHCQEQSAALKVLYDSLQAAHNPRFEVYAVGYESDVAKWKKYVKDHDFRWVNVGGPNVNIDYQDAYNVHGAPTMIILNERRDIIMNKTLPAKSILPFLDDYEKRRDR